MKSVGVSGLTIEFFSAIDEAQLEYMSTSGELPLTVRESPHHYRTFSSSTRETHDMSHAHHMTQSYTSCSCHLTTQLQNLMSFTLHNLKSSSLTMELSSTRLVRVGCAQPCMNFFTVVLLYGRQWTVGDEWSVHTQPQEMIISVPSLHLSGQSLPHSQLELSGY